MRCLRFCLGVMTDFGATQFLDKRFATCAANITRGRDDSLFVTQIPLTDARYMRGRYFLRATLGLCVGVMTDFGAV